RAWGGNPGPLGACLEDYRGSACLGPSGSPCPREERESAGDTPALRRPRRSVEPMNTRTAVIVSLTGLFASCAPAVGGDASEPEPQPELEVVGLGVEEGEDSLVAALSDGSKVYLYGATESASGSFVLESAAVESASGEVTTAELDPSGWPEKIVFADGGGIRLSPLLDGTVRARMWNG